MVGVETRLREITAVEQHSLATVAAGGKRLRPLLVFVAGLGSEASVALSRAAAAVELIHSATLVHDDVLDDAPLRRGSQTVFAAAGRRAATATGDLLFSSAFAELARNGAIAQLRALSAASAALARGELMQRADAWRADVTLERYLAALRAEDGPAVRRGLRAWCAGRRWAAARPVRARDGTRLPAARRRARRDRSRRAHRQAPRHRPAGRHRHAAADPRPRELARTRGARPARVTGAAGAARVCDAIEATGRPSGRACERSNWSAGEARTARRPGATSGARSS